MGLSHIVGSHAWPLKCISGVLNIGADVTHDGPSSGLAQAHTAVNGGAESDSTTLQSSIGA